MRYDNASRYHRVYIIQLWMAFGLRMVKKVCIVNRQMILALTFRTVSTALFVFWFVACSHESPAHAPDDHLAGLGDPQFGYAARIGEACANTIIRTMFGHFLI